MSVGASGYWWRGGWKHIFSVVVIVVVVVVMAIVVLVSIAAFFAVIVVAVAVVAAIIDEKSLKPNVVSEFSVMYLPQKKAGRGGGVRGMPHARDKTSGQEKNIDRRNASKRKIYTN